MVADMHAHYPMHVIQQEPRTTLETVMTAGGRPLPDKLRAAVLRLASRLASDRDWWSGHRVTVEQMQAGRVGLAYSVLYSPFDELDLSRSYGDPPSDVYFGELTRQLERVAEDVEGFGESVVRVVGDADTLDLAELEDLLRREYPHDWEAIASGNAVRVLRAL